MKIFFEGYELEYLRIGMVRGYPDFYFNHQGIHIMLYYREGFGWRICIGNKINDKRLRKTSFYQFINQEYKILEYLGEKMIRYLVLESPMRLQLLFEYGHELLEKTIEKAKNES